MSEKIPKGWKWVKLGELLNSGLFELLDRYRIPLSDNQRNKMKDGILYPYYGANGIIDYVNRYIFDGEFILVAEDGTVSTDKGKPVVQYVCGKFWVSNHAHVIKCENSITLKFLYYALKNVDIIPYITGAVQPKLNQRNLLDIEILYALDINEQKAIAEVLSSIDDKIDLLHRQNKTLEEMAMALFRKWFVEESDESWEVLPLGNLVAVKRGGSPRPIQEYLSDIGFPWLKISDATKEDSPFIFETKEYIKETGLNKTIFLKKGSLVLSNSATPGIPKILQIDSCIHDGWLYFPKSYFSNEFLYLLFKSIREEIIAHGNGSIFINLKTEVLKNYRILIPEKTKLEKFQYFIKPMFEKILHNSIQLRMLEKLRDTLLPKLMSGEVRVKF
jgi:type I restriction enzyme S subunit